MFAMVPSAGYIISVVFVVSIAKILCVHGSLFQLGFFMFVNHFLQLLCVFAGNLFSAKKGCHETGKRAVKGAVNEIL